MNRVQQSGTGRSPDQHTTALPLREKSGGTMSCKKKALAALIGSIFVVSATQAMAGASAKAMADTCAGCHGTNGASVGPASPTISGRWFLRCGSSFSCCPCWRTSLRVLPASSRGGRNCWPVATGNPSPESAPRNRGRSSRSAMIRSKPAPRLARQRSLAPPLGSTPRHCDLLEYTFLSPFHLPKTER